MKTWNKSGPSTLPWQTSLVTWQGLDREELILTRWDRPERKEDIQKKFKPRSAMFFRLTFDPNQISSVFAGFSGSRRDLHHS